MADRSRFLRDNPSDFPYDFEKQILSKTSPDTIYHCHPELEIIYVTKGLKVVKEIFFLSNRPLSMLSILTKIKNYFLPAFEFI